MGGRYPDGGLTYNYDCGDGRYEKAGCAGNASFAVAAMPSSVQQIFSDLGDHIKTGAVLTNCAPEANPCRQAIIDREGRDSSRKSWDPLAALVAVRGVNRSLFSMEPGTNRVNARGANTWVSTAATSTNQSYLAFRKDHDAAYYHDAVEKEIDELLCAPPKSPPPLPPPIAL